MSPSAPDMDICISELLSHSRTSDMGYVWARSAQTMDSTSVKTTAVARARCRRVAPMATVSKAQAAPREVELTSGLSGYQQTRDGAKEQRDSRR